MEVLIFGKETCAKCRTTKHKVSHLLSSLMLTDTVPMRYYDLETVDGMAEGAWRDVLGVPTVIIDDNSKELARWSADSPGSEEIKAVLLGQAASPQAQPAAETT